MAELGIPGSTLETNNLTYLDNSGDDYSSRAMTLGLDTIVNHIRLDFREGIRRRSYPRVGEADTMSASALDGGEGNVEHEQ